MSNTDLFGQEIAPPPPRWTERFGPRQTAILDHMRRGNPKMTLDDAVKLIGHHIYTNKRFHVGNVMASLVKRGVIRRIKPGHFELIEQ